MERGLINHPALYLSEYFEQRREQYIDHLSKVSTHGEWIPWILFVLKAIEVQATDAYVRGEYLLDYRDRLRSRYVVGRAGAIYSIIDSLFDQPSITVKRAATAASVSYQAARASIARLVEDGVLVETTQQRRNRVFYRAILGIESDAD